MIRIDAAGFSARKGQIVDAAIAPVPRQRNTREENRQIKAGDSPEAWSDNKCRQKDVAAHWTIKHGKSQVFEELLDENNGSGSVRAGSAYDSVKRDATLPCAHYRSQIHRKSTRKRSLNKPEQEANRKRSRVLARVECVFAQQANRLVRSIGQVSAGVKMGMMNLVYNMRRLTLLAG
ncbi:hypothetical protein [Candidatus Vondammii sp. HM_W22]|uniref:hypothetical protein n=1 Tax=Candidatus Vondammii sp. HM_W22 TaxID=2687299 RepID=UPI001F13BC0E|nr:hypothetical protein [Candidatus Vondammii sp. HM_W22]